MIYDVIDEALPAKVAEYYVKDNEGGPNYSGLLNWVNITFPLGLTMEKAGFDKLDAEQAAAFLIEKIKKSYEFKTSHENPLAVKSLERYIILNAIDRLWQEHLYGMDALREGVNLRRYGQKDPLIEYKTEAYEMFVELMSNIKNEILNNLFRSTSNLQAFEQFLAHLPHHLLSQDPDNLAARPAGVRKNPPTAATRALEPAEEPEIGLELNPPVRREAPKAGRNDPCPCGSGKKYKNCCGRTA
jgi:preprotein translocase subunit SecA